MITTVLIILAVVFALLAIFSVPNAVRWAGCSALCLALLHLIPLA